MGSHRYRLLDAFENTLDILDDVAVPKSKHFVAMLVDDGRPMGIAVAHLIMLSAIQLNRQFALRKREVDDVAADRVLAADFDR